MKANFFVTLFLCGLFINQYVSCESEAVYESDFEDDENLEADSSELDEVILNRQTRDLDTAASGIGGTGGGAAAGYKKGAKGGAAAGYKAGE